MKIGIIGAGNVGSTLGAAFARAGHEVMYARRDPSAEVPDRLRHPGARTGSPEQTADFADAVLLATPWAAAESAITGLAGLAGKPLLDATNPIGPGFTLTHGHTDSGAEAVQRWAPEARVVKVFNSTGRENMENPAYGEDRVFMLACGDDADAVQTAVLLAGDIGFDAVAFGPLSNARFLEPFAMVWIDLAMRRGHGRSWALGRLRR